MSDAIKALINQVIITARQRGLTQAALAERGGAEEGEADHGVAKVAPAAALGSTNCQL